MGGGGSKTTTYQQTDPWSGQQPYLRQAFSEAQSIYNNQKGTMPNYRGDFVAGSSDDLNSFNDQGLGWALGQGQQNVQNLQNSSTAGANGGLSGLGYGINGLFNSANTDYTGSNIAAANQYANNPYISGQVDAAMSDAIRSANENDLPGIDRASAVTGNLNNSGADISRGIVQRGLADKAADLSAQLRGNAWNTGLAQAASDNALRQQALSGATTAAGGLYSTGLNGMQNVQQAAQTNAVLGQLYGAGQTQAQQQQLDNAMQAAQYKFNEPWAALQNYWGIVGDKSWGSQGYSIGTQQTQPSALSTIGSIAGIFGSLMKCDIRTKTNIVFKDVVDGHRIYEFEYIDNPGKTFVGPMAQEVEQTRPDAVVEIDGTKYVNMTKLFGN